MTTEGIDDVKHVPTAYRRICEFHPHWIDIRADGVHQFISGWAMNRSGGGVHNVSLSERADRWVCRYHIERRIQGHDKQTSLL